MDFLLLVARLVLAAVFVVAAIGKVMDLSGSVDAVRNFGVPDRFARPIGYGLPVAEIVIAILLLPVSTAFWGAILAALLLLGFIAGIANLMRKGEAPDCHCFGAIHSEPVGKGTLVRNGVLLALALFILIGGTTPGSSLIGWLNDETGVTKALVVGLILALAAIAGLAWMTMHLLGQNGRLLIRMDELETEFKNRPAAPAPSPAAHAPVVRRKAPDFAGTGLIGDRVTLETLRAPGKPVLLFFSDPKCGPCTALLPEIAAWQRDLTDTISVAVVTRGSIDDAREKLKQHEFNRVLIEANRTISTAYESPGTPSAILIDKDGVIASDHAAGAENIRTLVNRVKSGELPAPMPPAAPARPSVPAVGTSAPPFELPGVAGERVSIETLTGEPRVLVFWNPGCGFCQRMGPDLHEWANEYKDGAVSLVIVTSGTEQQADSLTFADKVGFDQGFNTGRLFGASGTPSGILLQADGTVGSGLVVGGPAIMELLRSNSSSPAIV